MSVNDSVINSSDTVQGFSSGLEKLNDKFHAMVDEGKLANIVTLVAHHGEIVHFDAYGVLNASAATPEPVKTNSIFRIASIAKPITASAMMMLFEEGKWSLDDPVSKFIPEFDGLKVKQEDGEIVPQASQMNMKQLMSHSAGFGARQEYPDLRLGSLQDMIDFLATQPLAFQPGKDWRYGPSVDIQGYIIQKLTGQSLDEFLEQKLFAPLGMVDSGYVVPESKVERLVSNHDTDENGKLIAVDLPGTYNTLTPKFIGGGGGLMVSTVKDYWRFSQMILNGGEFEGRRYLKASTVKLMCTNVLEPGVNAKLGSYTLPELGFGLGFAIVKDVPTKRTAHADQNCFWFGIFGTWFWIDPVNDMIAVGFVNTIYRPGQVGSFLLREIMARLIYGAMEGSSKSSGTS
jgi:CubicO group peptidase (beta-lactamase class C family)